jgi:hypothetical protein
MDKVPDVNEDSGSWESYPDISKIFYNL